jgi:hypothetical protein
LDSTPWALINCKPPQKRSSFENCYLEYIMIMIASFPSVFPFLLTLSIIVCLGQAFNIRSGTYLSQRHINYHLTPTHEHESPRINDHSVALNAKKKRRRRREESDTTSDEEKPTDDLVAESSLPLLDGDELPDFDLDGEGEGGENAKKSQRVKISSNPDEITDAMMADANAAGVARSLDELITDRSLESKFEFEDSGDPEIPDFIQLAQESSSSSDGIIPTSNGTGMTKKQRQAERIANAIKLKEEEEQKGKTFLSNYPKFLNEKGEVSGVKILEQGGKQISA